MRQLDDISGKRFGKLLVIRHYSQDRKKSGVAFNRWECKCDCGHVFVCRGEYIKYGNCGEPCPECKRQIKAARDAFRLQIRGVWSGIIDRCENQRNEAYDRYGGRGIVICQRWRESIADFAEDMGDRPSLKHSVDRIDGSGNYSCGKCDQCVENGWTANCRWATSKEQIHNSAIPRFISHGGESLCMSDWAKRLGISREAMRQRVNRAIASGHPASYAITMTPSKGGVRRSI